MTQQTISNLDSGLSARTKINSNFSEVYSAVSGGVVSSVNVSGGTTGMTFTGGPITTSGTITAGGILSVANGGTGTATAFTAGSVVFAGASGVYSQDNANLFWDDANNRLGIGTSAPGAKLDVNGAIWARSDAAAIGVDVIGRAADNIGQIRFLNNAANTVQGTLASYGNDVALLNNTASFSLLFGTNSTERMRIDSAGNVGIGTSAPGAKLAVDGSVSASQTAGNYVGFGTGTFSFDGTTAADYGLTYTQPIDGFNTVLAGFSNIKFTTNRAERMRITDTGNVGIGTSGPGYRLDIASGDTTAGLGYAMRLRSNATATATTLQFTNSAVSAQNGVITCTDAGAMTLQSDGVSSLLAFRTNGSERARITDTGNVGIGTTSPNVRALLDVSSTTQGFLPPRMTEAQRDLITTPPNGLMLYNTTTDKLQVRAAGSWVDLH